MRRRSGATNTEVDLAMSEGKGTDRVILIAPGPGTKGGIAQFNTELTRRLRELDVSATILAYRRTYPVFSRAGRQGPDPSARQEDVPSEARLVPWFPWTWLGAAATIRRESPDVVVFQWWHPITALSSWYVARRARAAGAKVVFVCHNAWPHEGFPFAQALTRLALGTAHSLVALSDPVASELRRLLPTVRVTVIPHPPFSVLDETPGSNPDLWRRRIDAPAGAKIVLFFGNVRSYKGLRDLIDAFPRVVASTNAVLVVAGTFLEPIAGYRGRIDELGLGKSVRLFDQYVPNEEVAPLFELADLVVLPYRSASQSGVIPLAATFRKPVVATAAGGLPDSLAGAGIVVPPEAPDQLGAAIVRALEEPPPPPPPVGQELWGRWCEAVLSP
jgi:glycosyltransferase involved in cell wall biosynthesis